MTLVVALVSVVVVGAAAIRNRDAATSEVRVEPVVAVGDDPFTLNVATTPPPVTSDSSTLAVAPMTGAIQGYAGDTSALYGEARGGAHCDRQRLTAALGASPERLGAWTSVLGLQEPDLATYVRQLTPVLLRADTRVTSHGFAEARPTSVNSVLQAGTPVLVDRHGIPVVRCASGNPLTAPMPLTSPRYIGDAWPGFQPNGIVVIQRGLSPVATFVVHDVLTGRTFARPAGTDGREDAEVPPAAVPTSAPTTTRSTLARTTAAPLPTTAAEPPSTQPPEPPFPTTAAEPPSTQPPEPPTPTTACSPCFASAGPVGPVAAPIEPDEP